MALTSLLLPDAVICEYSYVTGTGAYTLSGAMGGHRAFSALYSPGDAAIYEATDRSANSEWVVGTYDGQTLSRTAIITSTNGGAPVDWTGRTRVFLRPLCECGATSSSPILSTSFTALPAVHFSPIPPARTGGVITPDGVSGGYSHLSSSVDNIHDIIGIANRGLTTTQPNNVLVAFVSLLGDYSGGPAPSVTGITGAGLTWIPRAAFHTTIEFITFFYMGAPYGIRFIDTRIEEWYAIAPTPLTDETFVASFSGPAQDTMFGVNGFSGVDLGTIWASGTVPATVAVQTTMEPLAATITTTDAAQTMVLGVLNHPFGAFFPPPLNAGYTAIDSGSAYGYPGRIGAIAAAGKFAGPLTALQFAPWRRLDGTDATITSGVFLVDALVA